MKVILDENAEEKEAENDERLADPDDRETRLRWSLSVTFRVFFVDAVVQIVGDSQRKDESEGWCEEECAW